MAMIAPGLANVNTFRYGSAMDEKQDRQSWLNAGLQALANAGPEGLRIMPIAEQLGVTKGSFYWHFKNLETYQAALLEEWEQGHTQEAIECVESTGGDGHAKLRKLFMGSAVSDLKLGRAIRSWSLTHSGARDVQARVDQKRIAYLAHLLRAKGWPEQDAQTLAHWSYWAFTGYATVDGPPVTASQLELVLQILTPK
jgi:AcrR family transcriptional regulator